MIIDINNKAINAYQILYYYTRDELQSDGTIKYNIYYRLDDGSSIIEEFDSESDRQTKIEDHLDKVTTGGGSEPTGNINITTTNQTNVKDYATAQVVDEDLVAVNIKKDVNILGIVGTYEGSGTPDWSAIGYSETPTSITDGYNYAKNIYDNWDSSITSMSSKYSGNNDLIFMPLVDTSNVTTFQNCFQNCVRLLEVPQLDTSKCTNLQYAFNGCTALQIIPQLDTSKCTNFTNIFGSMKNLITIPELDFSSATEIPNMFLYIFNGKLTNLGGFKDLGKAYLTTRSENDAFYKLDLSDLTTLTHDSLMNVINKLYDIKTKGCNNQALVLGATNLAKLSAEEIAIATNKGWNVS